MSPAGVSTAVRMLGQSKYFVLLGWAMLTVLGGLYARQYTANTRIDFAVPPSSKGYQAAQDFLRYFPESDVKVSALVTRVDGGIVLGDELRNLTHSLQTWCAERVGIAEGVVGYYTLAADLPEMAAQFVSDPVQPNASTSTLIVISLSLNASDSMASELAGYAHRSATLDVKLTGEPYFLQAALDGVTHDVEQVHPKVIPFAFVPFLWIVRSWRLSLITLVCILATAACSYFLMYLISTQISICNFAPSMQLSATIATSIDYSLFLLSRFREELPAQVEGQAGGGTAYAISAEQAEQALDQALHYAGHTVLVSGSTLALCFFGLLFFPISLISTLGLATGLTVVISICVNLSLLPALILSFPAFFTHTGCCSRTQSPPQPLPQPLASTSTVRRALLGASDEEADGATGAGVPLTRKDAQRLTAASVLRASEGSFWARVSGASIRYGWLVVLAFAALTAPCAYEALSIETSQTQAQMMPRDADASVAYSQIVEQFGSGSLFSFQLMIVPSDGQVESAAFFAQSRSLVRRTLELAGTEDLLNATGVMLAGATDVPFELLSEALHADEAKCAVLAQLLKRNVCAYARIGWRQLTNGDAELGRNASATYISLAPTFDPFSQQGTEVIDRLREALATARAEQPTFALESAGLTGGAVAMNDSVALVYDFFPMMVAITLSVVFALLGLAFRSLVVPVRAVLTISVSVVISFGTAWLVYGRGGLDFLGWAPLGRYGSLAWSAPVLSFPIMVGLGLDYDIFLLGRVLEYRLLGFSEKASVAAGVEHSGPLITAAGVIMAIAFGALLFSSSASLNQLAFLLTISVLVDTFLVTFK